MGDTLLPLLPGYTGVGSLVCKFLLLREVARLRGGLRGSALTVPPRPPPPPPHLRNGARAAGTLGQAAEGPHGADPQGPPAPSAPDPPLR